MKKWAYYNEWDDFSCEWLRSLIAKGLIPDGEVDNRSIADVQPDDLRGFRQHHFFCGIGGWPLALRLAGWPDDRPVVTGSCPCQPFSAAGKREGANDERHLWPEFYRIIRGIADYADEPPPVFGEQVASSEVVGTELEASFVDAVQRGDYAKANKLAKRLAQSRSLHYWARWIDGVQADLAKIDYAFRFEILGAHSVGAPHIRQRVFWVAYSERWATERQRYNMGAAPRGAERATQERERIRLDAGAGEPTLRLAQSHSPELQREPSSGQQPEYEPDGGVVRLADPDLGQSKQPHGYDSERGRPGDAEQTGMGGNDGGLDNPAEPGRQGGDAELLPPGQTEGRQPGRSGGGFDGLADANAERCQESEPANAPGRKQGSGQPQQAGPWSDFLLIPCRDGKVRRTSALAFIQPLAHGVPFKRNDPRMEYLLSRLGELGFDPKAARRILREAKRCRVGMLKGAGNAIVPETAVRFMKAFMSR